MCPSDGAVRGSVMPRCANGRPAAAAVADTRPAFELDCTVLVIDALASSFVPCSKHTVIATFSE